MGVFYMRLTLCFHQPLQRGVLLIIDLIIES